MRLDRIPEDKLDTLWNRIQVDKYQWGTDYRHAKRCNRIQKFIEAEEVRRKLWTLKN